MRKKIIEGIDKWQAYKEIQGELLHYFESKQISPVEIEMFSRLLKDDIAKFHEDTIESSGYVIHTLEASMWCILNSNSYKEAVLMAVNLGYDTDTTGAVTGGLAGLLYGIEGIPNEWLDVLARKDDILNL